jgi:urease accessory protein
MTRVYAMPDGGVATSRVDLSVRAGGYLEYLPEATILCRDGALRQEMRVEIDAEAHAAIGEVWAFGRAAHGELHAYRELSARTELWRGGSLVLADALVLKPLDGSPEPAVGGYAAYGTLTLSGPRIDAALLASVRRLLDRRGCQILTGASMLARDGGIAVRVLGVSANSVHSTLQDVIARFRRCVLDAVDRADHAGGGVR